MAGKSFLKSIQENRDLLWLDWCWGWTNERTLVKDMYHYCFRLLCSLSFSVEDCGWLWLQCLVGTNSAKQFWIFSFFALCMPAQGVVVIDAQARCFGHMLEGIRSFIVQRCGQNPIGCQKGPPVLQSCGFDILASQLQWVAQLGSYSSAAMAHLFWPNKSQQNMLGG